MRRVDAGLSDIGIALRTRMVAGRIELGVDGRKSHSSPKTNYAASLGEQSW